MQASACVLECVLRTTPTGVYATTRQAARRRQNPRVKQPRAMGNPRVSMAVVVQVGMVSSTRNAAVLVSVNQTYVNVQLQPAIVAGCVGGRPGGW